MGQNIVYVANSAVTDEDLLHWKYLRKYNNKSGKMVYVYPRPKSRNKKILSTAAKKVEKKEIKHSITIHGKELYSYGNDLEHWGILGQKHGIRRFQYPDGTLTPEGRIRYRDNGEKRSRSERRALQKEYDTQKKAKLKEEAARILAEEKHVKELSKKKINEMTNEELKEYISRKTDEKTAYNLDSDIINTYNKLHPEKVSAAKKFIDIALDKVVYPSMSKGLDNVFQALSYKIKNASLDETKSESDRLKQEANDWRNRANIAQDTNKYNSALNAAKKIAEETARLEEEAKKKKESQGG